MRGLVSVLALTASLAVPSLASAQEAATPGVAPVQAETNADPWQGLNRNLFGIHQAVDHAVLAPVARGYRAVTPRPLRTGVVNFLRNLKAPVVFANDLMQGEVNRASSTAGRFAINSTIGIGGLFDPAESLGLEFHDEDFGQTLAVWGVPSGPYLFVPLLGPSTVRDTAGRVVDVAFDPLTWVGGDDINSVRTARTVIAGVAQREALIEQIDSLEAPGGDTYVAYRSAFEVSREAAIQNGRADVQDLPDFDDIDEAPVTNPSNGGASAEANEQQTDQIQGAENSVGYTDALTLPTSMQD